MDIVLYLLKTPQQIDYQCFVKSLKTEDIWSENAFPFEFTNIVIEVVMFFENF